MRIRFVFAAAIVLSLSAGVALAHSPDPNANCNSIHDETLRVLGIPLAVAIPDDVPVVGGVAIYVVAGPQSVVLPTGDVVSVDAVQVWSESNGFDGAQTHGHACRTSPDHVSHTYGADTRVL